MKYSNKSLLKKPIMSKVIMLNKKLTVYGLLLPHGKKKPDPTKGSVDIRRCYLYPMLEKAGLLFMYAMRQLKGKDYLKRAVELIEEIQAQCYLIMELRGWNERTCAELDMICGEIIEHLYAISAAQKQSQGH